MMITLNDDSSENEDKRLFYCYTILLLWILGLFVLSVCTVINLAKFLYGVIMYKLLNKDRVKEKEMKFVRY